jgi:uncharacterized OB-fold protein
MGNAARGLDDPDPMSAIEPPDQRLVTVVEDLSRPEPVIHPEVEAFWNGLGTGRLLVQRCRRCGTWRFPIAPVCHRCRSFDYSWEPISPSGRVAAAVTVRRATGDAVWATHVPFASAIVDVDHGLRLPGRLLCRCGQGSRRGSAVEAVVLGAPRLAPVLGFAHGCPGGTAHDPEGPTSSVPRR